MSKPLPTHPLTFGVAGLGGYAGVIVDRLLDETVSPSGRSRLISVCDPEPAIHQVKLARVRAAGAELASSFDEMLADPRIQAIWLPLPIHLHRSYAERALAAGKHVICEKPAAGSVDDVDAMIAARDRSNLECLIAFQDVYQPAVQTLKRRLLSGELGRVQSATVLGCWPRARSYFTRNRWAGRLRVGESWVLDSPAANAMAHFIHLALYALGPTVDANAEAASVNAELYRANEIENYDTCSMRITLESGVDLTVAMTHACTRTIEPEVRIFTDRYRIRVPLNSGVAYESIVSGHTEFDAFAAESEFPVTHAIVRRLLHNDRSAPVGTLEMARAHTVLVNAASEATAVVSVPRSATVTLENGTIALVGIEAALEQCVAQRCTLHELNALSWTRAAGTVSIDGSYTTFDGPRAAADGESASPRLASMAGR